MYPCIQIDLKKLEHNANFLVQKCKNGGIDSIFGVTKMLAGDVVAIEAIARAGVTHLADSRIENLKRLEDIPLPKVLLRLPMQSELEKVVRYADYSLNSEWTTIEGLNEEAKRQNKCHRIILMFDLGDLREGLWFQSEHHDKLSKIVTLTNIKICGIGTNLTCYGGIIPTREKLGELIRIKEQIELEHSIQLEIISGGNSSSLSLMLKNEMPRGINNLRLGESIVLGRETAYGEMIEGCYPDVFELEAEIIELKRKPSVPNGEIGMDAFGHRPQFIDRGEHLRAILAIGRQDVSPEYLTPLDPGVVILGGSSDHLIVEVSKSSYRMGDVLRFRPSYGGLVQLMTSPYVQKKYL